VWERLVPTREARGMFDIGISMGTLVTLALIFVVLERIERAR
jgi:hypothetical protein